ncbi:hypothetical protein ACFOPQ_06295 [Deinococcus antarcticus]|uniref:Uncharacterized protein n=1 Tax=Deinococcus antarcticus TaxID=1298767 RepID=A0ABV8A4M3_9DEIO
MTVISPSRAEREQVHTARFMKMIPMFTPEAAPGAVAGAVPVSVPDVAERHSPTRSKAHQKPRKAPQLSTEDQSPLSPEAVPEWLTDALKVYEEQQARPPRAQVRLHQESEGQVCPDPQPPPSLADLLDLDALRPRRGKGAGTAGAGALATLLHTLTVHVLERRPSLRRRDGRLPQQVVLHLSAEMLAAALGVDESTARRWTQRLEEVGYLHARPHYTTLTEDGGSRTVVDGTLYAIRLEAGHQAHLSYQDLNRQYRDLNADRAAGRTAHAAVRQARQQAAQANSVPDEEKNMPGSTDLSISSRSVYLQLKEWAVTPGQFNKNPLKADPCIIPPAELGETLKTVQDVVYTLPLLAEAHPTKRAPLVGMLAATLARALNDGHSRAWYCRLIWNAWRAETEGRAGLRVLAAQLERLDIDRREWTTLRNPAALLAARLRAA